MLDEPTANLDANNARDVLEVLRDLKQGNLERGRTILEITHRLEGLEDADEILLLKHGHLLERGSHRSLVQKHGRYAGLIEHQRQILAT